ncbi:MAG: hypothetical protein AAB624_01715 [Patescibacteria group bacterium]
MTPKELGEHIDTRAVRRVIHSLHSVLLMVVLSAMISSMFISSSIAAPIGSRTLSIASSAPSATTNHSFSLNLNSATSVASAVFEYCQESPVFADPCTAPTGLNLGSAGIASQTGETGFSIHPSSTANMIVLTRGSSIVVPGESTYNFSAIINPSQANTTSYVRVGTYLSNDGSGSRTDEGGLAFSITNPLNIRADIPPYLTLCTGINVEMDCSDASGSSIDFGDLTPSSTASATSQFAVASNDDTGYNTYILGTTMTSGVNEIPAISSQSVSTQGSGQFGINLVSNSDPSIGNGPEGPGTGIANPSYDDSDLFKFSNGDTIASSILPTDFNRFTLTYIVNVANNQPAGIYDTLMTVLAVANF